MPSFDGFGAWIQVEKRRIFEYEKSVNEEERSTICFVESKTGMRFTVQWRVPSSSTASYLINLFVDGRFVDDCVSYASLRKRIDHFDGMWVDENTKSPFVFTDPTFGSDGGALGSDSTDDFGTIYVEMVEVRICDEDEDEDDDVDRMRPEMALEMRSVPEEKSSLLTHTVSSIKDETFRVKCPENCYFKEFPDPKPITSFTFRYRSEGYLQATGRKSAYGNVRRSSRKRKSRISNSERSILEPARKRERTTRSEDEVELKLEIIDEGTETESTTGSCIIAYRNVPSLTEKKIREKKDRLAREKAALEKEEKMLEAEEQLWMQNNEMSEDIKLGVVRATTRKTSKSSNIEVIDITSD